MSLQKFLQSHEIIYHITCPYSHAQNGSVERRHRHIVERSLSLLDHASMPFRYWFEAFHSAVFLINRMPTSILQNKSPFQILFKTSSNYNSLHVFGSVCWPNLCPFDKEKLDLHSKLCVFMGCSLDHKGYCCLHIPLGRTYISRDVPFNEDQFPFCCPSTSVASPQLVHFPASSSHPIFDGLLFLLTQLAHSHTTPYTLR